MNVGFDPSDVSQQRYTSYGPSALPNARDDEVEQYVDQLRAGGPGAVGSATDVASEAGRQVLRAYAERMASLAVRQGEPLQLLRGLVALVVGGLYRNELEALMVMSLVDNSAHRLGLETAELFGQASRVVGHPGSVYLMHWLTRSAEDRSIKAMGFVESSDGDGFRYKLDW